jgi:protein gp37
MTASAIEWTEVTWNPTVGCSLASPGCTNCYAMRMAARLDAMGMVKYRGITRRSGSRAKWTGAVRLDEATLRAPLAWRRPRRVFVNSMSDLFHEALPEADIRRVWQVMAETPQHTYQILTKRASRLETLSQTLTGLPNVWLGTSVETADQLSRLVSLRRARAAIRFVSFEPLIDAVGEPDLSHIHWAIVGGESGPGARPINREWVEDILRACRRHGTAFFFKQWGGRQKARTGRLLHGRTFDEYPQLPAMRER